MEFLNANENFLSMLKSSTREGFTADEIYIVLCLWNRCGCSAYSTCVFVSTKKLY